MSVEFILKAEDRTKLGKEEASRLRDDKKLPAVVYGAGIEKPVAITINYAEFEKLFGKVARHTIIQLEVGGKKFDVVVKDYKFHPITRRFMHIDFLSVVAEKLFVTDVPVNYTGTPVGVKEGGMLFIFTKKLKVRTTPKNLPNSIEVDVSHLKVKQYMIVREIEGKKDYQVLTNEGNVLVEIK